MLFRINNLKKTYNGRTVLDIPELTFERGRVYALLGPNGSGKTTLLEILSLLLPPTTGEIYYNNSPVDLTGNHLYDLRREIVMVHQNPILFSTTVCKNLEFCLKVRGRPRGRRKKTIEESLEVVGMKKFMNADAHKLSGGETQRVAIARALACSPRVIFFDEPTASVDVENQNAIERIIRDINTRRGISVVFTSHNLVQASRLSQEVIALFKGRKVPATFENIFAGIIEDSRKGHKTCVIHDRVRLSVNHPGTGPIRLCIDPLKVKIWHSDDSAPAENAFRGKLTQLTDENRFIRAVVDIGIPLNILMPREAFDGSISIGATVDVICPCSAIHVF